MTKFVMLCFLLVSVLVVEVLAEADTGTELSDAALERTNHHVTYDGSYQDIAYPGGDVAADRGVCTDVVVRSYRAIGIDLQVLVHEDMTRDFDAYPQLRGLAKPDSNIDHRRVPNLRRFFERNGEVLATIPDGDAFEPGDIVSWNLTPGGILPHIGIVTDRISEDGVPLVVHNVGAGPELENILFAYEMTGHFRFQDGM